MFRLALNEYNFIRSNLCSQMHHCVYGTTFNIYVYSFLRLRWDIRMSDTICMYLRIVNDHVQI